MVFEKDSFVVVVVVAADAVVIVVVVVAAVDVHNLDPRISE